MEQGTCSAVTNHPAVGAGHLSVRRTHGRGSYRWIINDSQWPPSTRRDPSSLRIYSQKWQERHRQSVTFWSPRRKLRPNDLVEIIYMVGCCCRYQDIIFVRKSLITSPYWLRQRVSTWRGWDPYSNCLDPGSWSDYQSYGADHLSKTGQLEYYTRHACTLFGMGGSNERTSYITWYVHSHFKNIFVKRDIF